MGLPASSLVTTPTELPQLINFMVHIAELIVIDIDSNNKCNEVKEIVKLYLYCTSGLSWPVIR
jgi:hypothetical protein